MKDSNINITNYLNTEYASYGMYTIENRAIPSVIDGFKPTQRKIIYIANKTWKTLNEKTIKSIPIYWKGCIRCSISSW